MLRHHSISLGVNLNMYALVKIHTLGLLKSQISCFHSALPTREPLFKVPKITFLVTSIISSLLIAKLKLIWREADMKILRRVWCGKIRGSGIMMWLTTGRGAGGGGG